MTRRRAERITLNTTGVLVFLVMIFPVYWMVSTAFKPGIDVQTFTPKWFPHPATLSNFTDAIHRPYFWQDVKNSVFVVCVVVALSAVLSFLAALALARFRFYGRKAFIVLIIAVQMVPLNALIIPLYIAFSNAPGGTQVNKLTGVVVAYLTFVLPFCIWTLRGFVMGIPQELEEAALVDGCSRLQALWKVAWPLAAPGIVSAAAFAFILSWTEFLFALVLTRTHTVTLPVALASIITGFQGNQYGEASALAMVSLIPALLIGALIQRHLVRGLTLGAVQG